MKRRILAILGSFIIAVGLSAEAYAMPKSDFSDDDLNGVLPEESKTPSWEDEFGDIVTEATLEYSDSYAGAGIAEDRKSAWIWFTRTIPQKIQQRAQKLPVPVKLRDDLPISNQELSNKQWDVYSKVIQVYPKEYVVSTSSVDNNQINIYYRPSISARVAVEQKHQIEDLLNMPEQDDEGTRVVLEADSSTEAVGEALYGGGYLSTCTAGFSIRKSGVTENGLVTAGHCTSPQRYGASGQVSLTRKGTYIGDSGDVAIYHVDRGWTAPKFYYAPGKFRDINAVKNTYNGQKICVNGQYSANKCTTVLSVNNCGDGACGLTATTDYVTQGGDSGAPWFWRNTGYGIHQGRIIVGGRARSGFTPVLRAQQLLNFQVKLS
ncbi:S1 family peptidase [Mobiluncus mulieris]|uniref:S1 family peptidase n=1 Tax=Mobiluncus mulieris TaxID=2052 RepID=UPI002431382F|nr:S1 family peptidase [Mobiluncus mulieris]